MKLLWISNAPWAASGYGSQTRQVVRRIRDAGIEVECVANDGTRGDREWEGILVRGSGIDRYSRDSVREDVERSGADRVVFLYDAWVFTESMRDPFEGLPHVYGWVPVDHYPTPLALYGWLQNGHHAIAMSRFGEMCLADTSAAFGANGLPPFPVSYAPHAIDRATFTPRDRRFREAIGVPDDAFLVGIVAANNGTKIYDRKGFGDMAHALGVFMARHPDAWVYVHTIKHTADGINLDILFELKGVPADRVRWADQYELTKQTVTDEDMALRYSALDVLLLTSRGEGFGIPALEAMACGVPVIVSNWTAQTEIVGGQRFEPAVMGNIRFPAGWAVGVDPDYDPRMAADFGKPRLSSIIGALDEAHEARGTMRDAALERAAAYDADAVFAREWRPILDRMAADDPPDMVPVNRAARRQVKREMARARS
jgi:glycosyltransferase involved in cell wall biosynthesis